MASPERKPATYEDLVSLGDGIRAEIVAGELSVSPSPLPRHAAVQRKTGRCLGGPFDDDDGRGGPGGWWLFAEVDVALGPHDIVRPDFAGWRRDRLPKPGMLRPIGVVPDWVCEIISPSSASRDRVAKRRLYASAGIPYYWLIDPELRALEALALREGVWVELGVFDDTSVARIAPFDAIELEVDRLFLPKDADGEG